MQIQMSFKTWPWWPKMQLKPLLFIWLGLSVLGAIALWPNCVGKAPASILGGATIWPELWQHQWWAVHKVFAAITQIAWWQWLGAMILVFGWGILFCFCLGRGLGHGLNNYLPALRPSWGQCLKLLILRSATTLFALAAGAFLFIVPIFLVIGAMSFWPDSIWAGVLVILLWLIICLVYIFPCIWADVLIVCHSPVPQQWPSNELYHRFLGAVSSHWRITKSFGMAGGVLLVLTTAGCFLQTLGPSIGNGSLALLNWAWIFTTGMIGLILAYHFGRQVARDESPALTIIRKSIQAI